MFCNYCRASNPDDGRFCSCCGRDLTPTPVTSEPQDPLRSAPTEMTLPPGTMLLNRYRILRELGVGGMGRVYLAHDEKLEMPVAIKVLRDLLSRDPGSVRRLIAEAKHSMMLSHANVVRVHNFEDAPTVKFLVMEYVEGESLAHLLARKGKLPEEETRAIAIEICKGLQHAHQKRIVHRDLKPGNILIGKDGSIKIADFGIARLCRDSMSRLTSQQDSGTLLYMSPEQLDGESGEASDLYSLGVVLYEMLSGDPPFITGEITAQIRHKTPREILDASDGIRRIVMKCIEKKPENRFHSLQELLDELQRKEDDSRQPELAPTLALLKLRGTKAFDEGRYADAIANWEEALSLKPGDAALNDALALARQRQTDVEKKEASRRRAEEEAERKETARRESERQQAEAVKKQWAETVLIHADSLLTQGKYQEAENYLVQSLQADPNQTMLSQALARCREAMKKRQEPPKAEIFREALPKPRGSWKTALLILGSAVVLAVPSAYWIFNEYANDSSSSTVPQSTPGSSGSDSQSGAGSAAAPPESPKASAGSATGTAASSAVRRQEPVPESRSKAVAEKPTDKIPGWEDLGSRKDAANHIADGFEKFMNPDDPPANPALGTTWKSPDGSTMAWIPPGTFLMGSPAMEYGHTQYEEPVHSLSFTRGFWIDTMEVTNSAFQAFVLANPQWQKGSARIGPYVDGNYLKTWMGNLYPAETEFHPVRDVSWHAALAYARWVGKRLPLEAEWEYACRAGTTSAYWWGPLFNPNFGVNSPTGTLPTGNAMRRNAWGLYDMSGNVAEWTSGLFAAYPYRGDDGRENLQAGGTRTVRGGAWNDDPRMLRSAWRGGSVPTLCSSQVGFRCVR